MQHTLSLKTHTDHRSHPGCAYIYHDRFGVTVRQRVERVLDALSLALFEAAREERRAQEKERTDADDDKLEFAERAEGTGPGVGAGTEEQAGPQDPEIAWCREPTGGLV